MKRPQPRALSLITNALRTEDGIAALAIAAAIAVFAFTSLSFLTSSIIGGRELSLLQGGGASWTNAKSALIVQINSNNTVVCPDRDLDGVAEGTCDGSGGNERNGTLPWSTLGISPKDAIDPYGNYYTYVVSDVAKDVCLSIGNDYDSGAAAEVTGSLIVPTDLETLETSETLGTGIATPFVVLSHGPNGYGATSEAGVAQSAPPVAHTFETNNASDNPTAIYTGPYDITATDGFDDEVFTVSPAELRQECEWLTPGGALNATLTDNFENVSGGIDSNNFDTTGSGTPPTVLRTTGGDGVASFTNNTSYIATATSFDLSPRVRPLYIATEWTPSPNTPAATTSGFSIATRATVSDLTSGTDQFNGSGITFRFDDRDGSTSSAGGVLNNIRIRENTTDLATSASQYTLANGETYLIEVYDNGTDVWMRITQVDDPTNTAFASTTTSADLTTGDQRVLFINGPVESYIDDVVVGVPMLALETNGSSGYAATAAAANGTGTGNLSLEAWVRPTTLPSGSNRAAIISQWDTSGAAPAGDQSFRLYLDSSNSDRLFFDIGGTISSSAAIESFDLGYIPTTDEWVHLAVTFDSTSKAVRFYVNGELARSLTSGTDASTGVASASERFSVGAAFDSGVTAGDFFHGNISDVRVWDDVRTRNEILDCFQVRLPTSACTTANLVANWKLNPSPADGGLAETDAVASPAGTSGTLTSSSYTPALAVFFRPFSTSFCPSGTRVGAYQCDFRTSVVAGSESSITIPSSLRAIHAKAWGAGGGGYDVGSDERDGGSGGFSQGLIESINSVAIAGQSVNVYAGGFGTGSTTADQGAGGGAGSGVYNSLNTVAGLIAGGGGGASFSTHNVSGGGNCNTATNEDACGLGGHGAGVGTTTTRAPAEGSLCGGRGGNNTPSGNDPPSVAGDCDDGGTDPVGTAGGAGTTGPLGGGAGFAVLSGGRGIDSDEADGNGMTNAPGGGGGGGGAIGGEAGGYDDNNNARGYGGGGGSGTADAGVSNASGEVSSGAFSDGTRTGDGSNNSPIITNISSSITGVWEVGMTINDLSQPPDRIPDGTTIISIDSATQITMSANFSGNQTGYGLLVTGNGSAGGSDDPDYSPSYLSGTPALQNPGVGGTTGADVDGNGGAVVLKW